ncbi:OsmC family protein [Photobacterium sanguinicancri]|uniref:OsmC family protein n=1 Tax=Photobacterium sanguinicancri TaxID=875932 RepID=UPI00248149F4|nr:OsmC family protein [Photobacterium sanguinicancri]
MTINVKWAGDCQFKITTSSGFNFDIDATSTVAPCPTDMLLSALGACSATDVVLLLKEKGFSVKTLDNNLTYTLTESEPRLYESANLHFVVTGDGISKDDVLIAAQEAVLKHCHVCLMLQPSITISCSAEVL